MNNYEAMNDALIESMIRYDVEDYMKQIADGKVLLEPGKSLATMIEEYREIRRGVYTGKFTSTRETNPENDICGLGSDLLESF